MLSGTKKVQPGGQDWFVVLNPLKSELERNKIAREIAKAFCLPVDEALDLVQNTPIILMDNLLYATALQVKQYFRSSPADIVVSNDSFLKRRCYRTVWPTQPNLAFLHQLGSSATPSKKNDTEKLDHGEAIQEIRSWVQTEGGSPERGDRRAFAKSGMANQNNRHFRSILEEEGEKLLKESVGLKENVNQLRKALEKAQSEVSEKERAVQASEAERKQKEKEAQELQALVSHSEEKYELLREEFRQTRHYFEEKLGSEDHKSEEFLKQIEERDLAQKELLREKQALLKSFHGVKNDLQRAKDEQEQARREWESQAAQFRRELENQKTLVEGLHAKIKNLEEGKKIVQSSETRLIQELELQSQQAKRWEQRSCEFEKEIRQLRASFEDQQKSWQVRLSELEAREMDLENARKQIRQLHSELDQRETVQKKNQLHEQLVSKEARLKQVVKQQEKIESEIRDREEDMRKLLAEQETIEREVIEAKQAQRHLAEKVKHDVSALDQRKPVSSPAPSEFHTSHTRPEAIDD
jgi:chromosome segregation ATPase